MGLVIAPALAYALLHLAGGIFPSALGRQYAEYYPWPVSVLSALGTGAFLSRYLRMLGYTLADMGQLEEAIDIIEESLLRKDDPAHKRELRQALDKLYTLRKEAP
ncbi:MAG: hypothetical protein VX293_06750 [Candidatus Latescibacterota bacterium]|nr:hypothetical protein [Candidatus Latescibacterota bacterium]